MVRILVPNMLLASEDIKQKHYLPTTFAFCLKTQNTVCIYANKQKQNFVQSAQKHAKNRATVSADSASSQGRLSAAMLSLISEHN